MRRSYLGDVYGGGVDDCGGGVGFGGEGAVLDGGGGGIDGGCGASATSSAAGDLDGEDPAHAFCQFSFHCIPRENWFRKVCIRIVLNP